MSKISLAAAISEVAGHDPVLANLVAVAGPITYRPGDPDGHFGALVRAITFQQLAGPAARAIHQRVRRAGRRAAHPGGARRALGRHAARGRSVGGQAGVARDLSSKVMEGSVVLAPRAARPTTTSWPG